MNSSVDFEQILRYNPRKIEIVNASDKNYKTKISELKNSGNAYEMKFFVKADTNYYWVLDSSQNDNKLFKLYSGLDYLNYYFSNKYNERKIGYYYLPVSSSMKKVITIWGYDNVELVLDYFKPTLKLVQHNNRDIYQLNDNLYLYREPGVLSYGEVFPDIETLDRSFAGGNKPMISFNKTVLNFNENISFLNRELGCNVSFDSVTKTDLMVVASKCFDYVKEKDLFQIYSQLYSLLIKYMIDNEFGEVKMITSGSNTESFIIEKNGIKHSISLYLSKTIENLILYEFYPDLYFHIDSHGNL